jgi:hypothetical protein
MLANTGQCRTRYRSTRRSPALSIVGHARQGRFLHLLHEAGFALSSNGSCQMRRPFRQLNVCLRISTGYFLAFAFVWPKSGSPARASRNSFSQGPRSPRLEPNAGRGRHCQFAAVGANLRGRGGVEPFAIPPHLRDEPNKHFHENAMGIGRRTHRDQSDNLVPDRLLVRRPAIRRRPSGGEVSCAAGRSGRLPALPRFA